MQIFEEHNVFLLLNIVIEVILLNYNLTDDLFLNNYQVVKFM